MVDINKIEQEIKRLIKDYKFYWYDFNVDMKDAKIIKEHFEKFYPVELKPCPKSRVCDVIIDLTRIIK